MKKTDAYRAQEGEATDKLIHEMLFGELNGIECPPYSSSNQEASRVLRQLKRNFKTSIVTGRTQSRLKPYFARYGTDVSTSTEVLAETLALAICRLALLLLQRDK
jgi:hypothetical protein